MFKRMLPGLSPSLERGLSTRSERLRFDDGKAFDFRVLISDRSPMTVDLPSTNQATLLAKKGKHTEINRGGVGTALEAPDLSILTIPICSLR
jgi:hypothetical protein